MKIAFTSRVLLLAALGIGSLPSQAASVFGRAIQKNGSKPAGPCHASLRAELDRRGAPEPDLESAADGKTSFSVPLNERGYFQVVGVSPGMYVLAIECPAASGVRELRVQANSETRIDPLPLEELTLAIAVTPKVDPSGKPWQLTVDATVPRLRRIADKATTSTDGQWARRGLSTGNYRVTISSSDETPWLQRFFNLSTDSGPLLVQLPFMRISGQVRLNMQPVRARLVFHNEAGGEPMTLASGDDGFFQGLLPVTPGVQETRWTVEARGTRPPISRRLSDVSVKSAGETSAWLDLALPVFPLHGTVVSERGQLQSGVQVTFEDTGSGARTTTATDDTGSFELSDLPTGNYTVVADSVEGVSDPTPFEVVESSESELKLVLKPSERIPFYVVSSSGPVADAAVQVWITPGVPRFFTRTDQAGHFDAKLPPGTTDVGLTVGAPGYAIKLTRLQISSENESRDANTITLDESGGTLMLDLHPLGRALDSSATPYLVHNRSIEAVGTFANWGSDFANASGDSPAVVKAIEPGIYALCLLTDPAQVAALWLGAPPSDRCRTGSVEQGRTLTLSPP